MVIAKDKQAAETTKSKLKVASEEERFDQSLPTYHKDFQDKVEVLEHKEKNTFGPTLPPNLQRREVVGPVLPKDFVASDMCDNGKNQKTVSEDEDEEDFGPLPADHPAARESLVQLQLEHRAMLVQAKFKDKVR